MIRNHVRWVYWKIKYEDYLNCLVEIWRLNIFLRSWLTKQSWQNLRSSTSSYYFEFKKALPRCWNAAKYKRGYEYTRRDWIFYKHPLQHRKWKEWTDVKRSNSLKASPATGVKNPRMSWSQVWKQMHLWPSLLISTCWCWAKTQREVETRRYSRSSWFSEEWKKSPRLRISKLRSNEVYSPESWQTRLNASAGHTMKFLGCTWYETKIREGKRAIWRHYPKRRTSWAKSLRARFWGANTWWNLTRSRLWQQSSLEFGEKKMHYAEQERFKLKQNGYPLTVLSRDCESSNKRGRTRFLFMIAICSWQCDYSMKRQRFYCFIYFAQNTDIHTNRKKRWNCTIDPKWEDNYLYNEQLRTSCRTRTVIYSSSSLSSTSRSTDQ